ncbi:MAG: ABC transporter ATP-binding protein [Rhodothermia bacterium]|nr:MAG: ABC transporter ATP-binding protein [Rhodothermia bacterium]
MTDRSSDTPLLEVSRISKSYPNASGGRLPVLKNVSFTVTKGEMIAVVGESGTGKSTLLHLIGALDRPDEGSVRFNGEDVFSKSDEELSAFRNTSIGFVFQFHHLLPEFSALENVTMPALIKRTPMKEARNHAADLLVQLGLKERLEHRPAELSGGEKQRVAVARALMNGPDLVLADEPTGNLDAGTAEKLHTEIVRLCEETGQTFIVVTHNPAFAKLSDRVMTLADGRLFEDRS